MAIAIHIVQFRNVETDGELERRIAEDEAIATTANNPTLAAFLAAEAAAGYLLTFKDDDILITANVADINAS